MPVSCLKAGDSLVYSSEEDMKKEWKEMPIPVTSWLSEFIEEDVSK